MQAHQHPNLRVDADTDDARMETPARSEEGGHDARRTPMQLLHRREFWLMVVLIALYASLAAVPIWYRLGDMSLAAIGIPMILLLYFTLRLR